MSTMLDSSGPWSFAMVGETNYARIYLHDAYAPCNVKGGDSLQGYCGVANARLIVAAPTMAAYIAKKAAEGDAEAAKIMEEVHGSV